MRRGNFRPRQIAASKVMTKPSAQPAAAKELDKILEQSKNVSQSLGTEGPIAVLVQGLVDVLIEQMVNIEGNVKQMEFALASALKPIVGVADEVARLRTRGGEMEKLLASAVTMIRAAKSDTDRISSNIDSVGRSSREDINRAAADISGLTKAVGEIKKTVKDIQKKKMEWDGKDVMAKSISSILDKLDNLPKPESATEELEALEAKLGAISDQLAKPRKVVRDRDGNLSGWKLGN